MPPLRIIYRNWRGETRERRIRPFYGLDEPNPWFGIGAHHGNVQQWFLHATDVETGEPRDFAMADILSIARGDEALNKGLDSAVLSYVYALLGCDSVSEAAAVWERNPEERKRAHAAIGALIP